MALDYRKDIQVLRGMAVLVVVGYHLSIPGFKNGFLGVDLFFVISGFLMAAIYKKNQTKIFYLRRANRLLPAYFVTILITIGVSFFRTVPSDFLQVIEQSKYSIGLTPNLYFWSLDSYFASSNFNPLLHLWSLGVEFQFYLIVPILISLFGRNKLYKYLILFGSLAGCFLVLSLSPKTSFFLVPFRIWEFIAGMIAYELFNRRRDVKESPTFRYFGIFSLLSMLGTFLLFPIDGFSTAYAFGHPGLGSLVMSLSGMLYLIIAPRILLSRWLEILGKYSYSIYLSHFPIIVLIQYKEFAGTSLNRQAMQIVTIQILLIILLSILLYKLVENPFRRREIPVKFWISSLLSAYLLISSIAFLNLQQLSNPERNIVKARFDRSQYRCGKIVRILKPVSKVCIVGEDQFKKKILLLGNSYADAIKVSFASAANQNLKTVFFWVQSNPLMSGSREISDILDEIQREGISEVYLHYSSYAVNQSVILKFKNQLKFKNVALKVLGPIPTWDVIVPEELWRFKDSQVRPPKLEQTHDVFLNSRYEEFAFLTKHFQKDVDFYDLASVMCTPGCSVLDSLGVPLYWDSGHLTLTGARTLEPKFKVITGP
jgi:peptidoglycan/LPS O-acetylase OafA/YrhL